MGFKRFESVRARSAAVAVGVSAAAMAAMLAAVAFFAHMAITQTIEGTLRSQLDSVAQALESGTPAESIDVGGSVLVQVIDQDGNVVATNQWAQGLASVSQGVDASDGNAHSTKVDDLSIDRADSRVEGDRKTGSSSKSRASATDDDDDDDASANASSSSRGSNDDDDDDRASSSGSSAGSKPGSSGGSSSSAGSKPAAGSSSNDDDDDSSSSSGSGSGSSGSSSSGSSSNDDDDDDSGSSSNSSSNDDDDSGGNDDDNLTATALSLPMQQGARVVGLADQEAAGETGASQDVGSALACAFGPQPAYAATIAEAADQADAGQDAAAQNRKVTAGQLLGQPGPYVVVERDLECDQGTYRLAAMASLAPALSASIAVAKILAFVFLAALVLIGAGSWLLVSRAFKPVTSMSEQASRISISNLDARLPVPEGDPDLSQLAGTFNDLLERLEYAVNEHRRFVSDASHELKSPVAAVRVMLETMRDHPEAVDASTVLADAMGQNDRMGGIVSDLLLLARQDEGRVQVERTPLDLSDLLFEEAAVLRSRFDVDLDVSGIEPVVCKADSEGLSHAVRNMLENAARYAQSRVVLSCHKEGDRVLVCVSDDGPGVPAADRERVFDRFVRLESSRSRKEGSTGLGLAVVRTIAQQHGGNAWFEDGRIGGATIVLSIAD